jgi:hypothetical protein
VSACLRGLGAVPGPQKYLTTPNRLRKFANILDPGGVSWWLMGLELEVSAKEYRNPHPLLSFRSIPTATWSAGFDALKLPGGLIPFAIPADRGSAVKWTTPVPTARKGRTQDDRGLK